MTASAVVRQSVAVADPDHPGNFIAPNADGSINIGPVTDAVALSDNTTAAAARAIQITASAAGTVTLTLSGGSSITVTVGVGDNIYPYAVTKATAQTAVVTSYYNLT